MDRETNKDNQQPIYSLQFSRKLPHLFILRKNNVSTFSFSFPTFKIYFSPFYIQDSMHYILLDNYYLISNHYQKVISIHIFLWKIQLI